MRFAIAIVFGLLGFALAAQTPPPGSIVIRPKGSTETPAVIPPGPKVILQTDPDRPGFYVIRPSGKLPVTSGSVSLPTPREGVPHLEIIRPKPMMNPEAPTIPFPRPTTPLIPEPVKVSQVPEEVKDGKILSETWDVAFCRGYKVGYTHTVVREYDRDKVKMIYGTKKLVLQVARFGQSVEIWGENATIETPEGKVIVTQTRQGLGKETAMSLTGTATKQGLAVKIEGAINNSETIPWPEGVLGVGREATLLKDKQPKLGESVDYLSYEGRINRVVKMKMTAKGPKEFAISEGQKAKKWLEYTIEMEPAGEFKLPPATLYADPETLEPMRVDSDMPTLGGKMMVLRTTKEFALRAPTKRLDLGEAQSIVLDKPVGQIHERTSVTYRVQFSGDAAIEKIFPVDDRQQIENVEAKAKAFDLTVTARRKPVKPAGVVAKPGKEYLGTSFFIDWDTDLVKRHAAAAIRNLPAGSGDWQKAQAVETWVRNSMKSEFSQAMEPCASVAKNLNGDCSEFSMLATGMCRALGIPSRTALGVVYVPAKPGEKPTLAYHMWFEVWIEGLWLSLDGTLGLGSIGPGHIKITDSHWDGERGFTPLLPVLGVLGSQPKITIGSVDGR